MNTSPCYIDEATGLPVHALGRWPDQPGKCTCTPMRKPGTFGPNDPSDPNYDPGDPAYALMLDGHTTKPIEGIYRDNCYICRDPEFSLLGMPLCYPCPYCSGIEGDKTWDNLAALPNPKGHVPADDEYCDDCGESLYYWLANE